MKKALICLLMTVFCITLALAEDSLPAYSYPGNDPVEAAVASYLAETAVQRYPDREGSVVIPAPVLFKTEQRDDGSLLVYGNFWTFSYVVNGSVLECVAGGECPGIITLTKSADGWTVAACEKAGDGTEYRKDILRFCHGDKALEHLYFDAPYQDTRLRFIEEYAATNGLDITAYQDYGWEPVPLFTAVPRSAITAIASEINPDNLVSVAVDARITSDPADSSLLSMELIIPERFDPEEVRGLAVGDAIYTQGQEIAIRTISEKDGYLVLNEGDCAFSDGSVWLYEHPDGSYWIANAHGNAWTVIAEISVPVADTLLFLDGSDPARALPEVYSAEAFLRILAAETKEGPGFTANNVCAIFDGAGQLAMIYRHFVPWL